MNEGRKLILEALSKAYEDASARVQGLGMSNIYGLSGVEKAKLDAAYQAAQDDMAKAKRALDEYLKQIGT